MWPERPAELGHAGSVVLAGETAGGAGQADVEERVGGGAGQEGVRVGHLHQAPIEMVLGGGRVESLLTLTRVAAPHPPVAGLEGALRNIEEINIASLQYCLVLDSRYGECYCQCGGSSLLVLDSLCLCCDTCESRGSCGCHHQTSPPPRSPRTGWYPAQRRPRQWQRDQPGNWNWILTNGSPLPSTNKWLFFGLNVVSPE